MPTGCLGILKSVTSYRFPIQSFSTFLMFAGSPSQEAMSLAFVSLKQNPNNIDQEALPFKDNDNPIHEIEWNPFFSNKYSATKTSITCLFMVEL